MDSQSQIERACLQSRSKSHLRHYPLMQQETRRRKLELICLPLALVGLLGIVYYVTRPLPVEHWYIGMASVLLTVIAFCIPYRR